MRNDYSWVNTVDQISLESSRKELATLLDKYDWFYDCVVIGKTVIVYAHRIDVDVLQIVPRNLYGYNVLVHFAQFAQCEEMYAAIEPAPEFEFPS